MRPAVGFLVTICLLSTGVLAQKPDIKKDPATKVDITHSLRVVQTTPVPSELGGAFLDPMACDADGNLYLKMFGVSANEDIIKKVDNSGKKVAQFSLPADNDLKGMGYFFVGPHQEVYAVSWGPKAAYVVSFDRDGTFKSKKKLDLKFTPSQIAVFSSGDFLVVGLEYDGPNFTGHLVPYTAVFDTNWTLIKRISFEDDAELQRRAESGDRDFVSPTAPTNTNRAVALGMVVAGQDGNIYLMRRVSPAVIYAISPAGEVVRRIVVEPDAQGKMPSMLQESNGRLAVMFWDNNTGTATFKMVNESTGEELTKYKSKGTGSAFACYAAQQNQFTFLRTLHEKLAVARAEPE